MKRQAYYPSRSAEQAIWLENFRNKLPTYGTTLGLSAGQVTAGVADARWLFYIITSWLGAVRTFSPACTDAATAAMTGAAGAALVLPGFTAPALPAGVVPVAGGALTRLFALVQTIKDSATRTDAIETDLRTVGAGQTGPDLATIQPAFAVTVTGGHVHLAWTWAGNSAYLDLLEIEVDRGAGFVPLVFDTTPGYDDTTPFPATLTKWTYRAIFRVNDARVGLWSDPVSVAVGG